MKITFVIYSLGSGGAERAVTGLANFWAEKHDVTIITLIKTTSFYPLNKNISQYHCLKKPQLKTTMLKSIKNGFLRIYKLTNILKAIQPDAVISFMHTSNIYAIWACKWLGIPCVISERANHAVVPLPKTQELIRNFSYPYSSSLVVQTDGNKKYYQQFLKHTKINIIQNAVATEFKLKRLLQKKQEENIILNVGAFRDGKAQDVLIRAFAKLSNPTWHLVFLGKGPNLDSFKKLASDLGIADKITFEGAQKDVAAYYNKASLFVFTSEHEGFPNALLEALYFGIPTISTNCPHGPADLIENGVNGFLIPVGNQDVLTKNMEILIKDNELRKSFSKKAIEESKQYEIENIAEKWMDVLKSFLSNK